jgi:hypothetical protein
LLGRIGQMGAAELQARRHAAHLAAHCDRLFGKAHGGQRQRVGRFARIDQAREHRIEQRSRSRVVGRLGVDKARRRRQQRAVVQAVEQGQRQAQHQNHR